MTKHSVQYYITILLAYVHRYLYPLLIILPWGLGKEAYLLKMGIGCLCLALHSLIGYLFHWKHIYCSFQNAYHQKMTPDHVQWHKIKKSDAYGIPAIFGFLGATLIIVHLIRIP